MKKLAAAATTVLLLGAGLTACASPSDDAGGEGGDVTQTVIVGALTSLSGANSVSGEVWLQGFEIGLDFATDETRVVDGIQIEVEEIDDQSDPVTATTAATNLVADGVRIIAGTQSSAIAEQLAGFAADNDILYVVGSANSNSLTGINRNTFRGGQQAYQTVSALISMLGDDVDGQKVGIIAHDIEYGKSLIETTTKILGDAPESITQTLAPFPTTDVAPFVQKLVEANPGVVIPYWSGDVAPLWQAFTQQDVFTGRTVAASLGYKASWPAFAAASENAEDLRLYSSWMPGATDTAASEYLTEKGGDIENIAADGFAAAQMIVHALQEAGGDDDTEALITALEGYTFEGPRGETEIRAGDHAFIANSVLMHFEGGEPHVDGPLEVPAPPEVPMQ